MTGTKSPENTLRVSRVVKGPRSLIWDAFTRPEQLAQWFAPGEMTAQIHRFDFRVGGAFEVAMVEEPNVPITLREPSSRLSHRNG